MRAERVPEGYDGSARYTVQEQDERNPQHPVYYTIDCSVSGSVSLSCQQPGPWREWSYGDESEMYVRLETLVELGRLAQEILDGTAVPDSRYVHRPAWKLLVDGEVWDYSTHREDCERWAGRVRAEEPERALDIVETTREEMTRWKES